MQLQMSGYHGFRRRSLSSTLSGSQSLAYSSSSWPQPTPKKLSTLKFSRYLV
ncbi:hypothetical protein CRYUN_Cryun03dG0128900 [Craigia yunnanensis]